MRYAFVLAGGIGSRMGQTSVPKQFLLLNDKPVIVHTCEVFLIHEQIDKILVLVPKDWLLYTENLLKEYHLDHEKLVVIEGGSDRNETIYRGCRYLQDQGVLSADDIVVSHDGVRPFLTYRIISENLEFVAPGVAVDTVIAATDTIIESEDGKRVSSIPVRSSLYQGQTPQTFFAVDFMRSYETVTPAVKQGLSDACKLLLVSGLDVCLVRGEQSNMKITTFFDFKVANAMIEVKNDQ